MYSRNICTALIITFSLMFFSNSFAIAYEYKALKKWHVSCSNSLTCQFGPSAYLQNTVSTVFFERSIKPNADIDLVFTYRGDAKHENLKNAHVAIRVDQREVLAVALASFTNENSENQLRFSNQKLIDTLLLAIGTGHEMQILLHSEKENEVSDFSLSGSTAALIFVDEAQMRLGQSDALNMKGEKAPVLQWVTGVDAISELPASLKKVLADENGPCGEMDKKRFSLLGAFSLRIGEKQGNWNHSLFIVPCGLGGAYNQLFAFFEVRNGLTSALSVPIMGEAGPSIATTAYNISFNLKGNYMTSFYKGRGLGDCGVYQKWFIERESFDGRFTLLEQRSKGDCDGNYAGGPEKWPASWPPE